MYAVVAFFLTDEQTESEQTYHEFLTHSNFRQYQNTHIELNFNLNPPHIVTIRQKAARTLLQQELRLPDLPSSQGKTSCCFQISVFLDAH
jgi:hypothetical protein